METSHKGQARHRQDSRNDTVRNGRNIDLNFYVHSGDNVSISGGAGNDTIHNGYGDNVSINGGAVHIANRQRYLLDDKERFGYCRSSRLRLCFLEECGNFVERQH